MRRLVTSWSALAVLLVIIVAGTGLLLQQLQRQVSVRAELTAVETARVVTALVVNRNVQASAEGLAGLTPSARQEMDADIAVLLAEDRLVGLELWDRDGDLVYADAEHPADEEALPADDLEQARRGAAWSAFAAERARGRTLEVFLPLDLDRDGVQDGLAEVHVPESHIAAGVARTSRLMTGGALVVLLLLGTILITLRRRLLAREHDALHDPLTGLPNRAALQERTARAVGQARAGGHRAALMVLDLDGFKAVNDTLGHPAGDALLVQVGACLRASLEPADLVARLGGDEFAVLLTDLTDLPELSAEDRAAAVAGHLLNRLRIRSYQIDGITLSVDASIGIALLPEHGQDVDLLLQRADVAMYQAKTAKSGVTVYDVDNDPHHVSQLEILVELRQAIDRDELVLHYQPKVNLHTARLEGVEALVRWHHPAKGLVPPSDFIPLAENTGLMQPLTEWVLRQAVGRAARWRDQGLAVPVAVNISPRSLLDRQFVPMIANLLAQARLPADLLEIEITETAIMTDPVGAAEALGQLQAMGVHVAIDDFGVGYTSLAYLKSLPVNTLKIDRHFITNLLTSDKDQAIVQSVIALGHRLGLTVLAEGIETQPVLDRLQRLDCDEIQGYHLARPMPADQITAWIADYQGHPAGAPHDAAPAAAVTAAATSASAGAGAGATHEAAPAGTPHAAAPAGAVPAGRRPGGPGA